MASTKTKLVVLTCAASILPYLIPYVWGSVDFTRGYDFPIYTIFFLGAAIWLVLLIITLKVGDRMLDTMLSVDL
jgi:hypothetical protein